MPMFGSGRASKNAAAIVAALILSVAAVPAVVDPVADNVLDQRDGDASSDALAPLVLFAVGILIGTGWAYHDIYDWWTNSSGGGSDVTEAMTEQEAKNFRAWVETHTPDISGALEIDTQLMGFTQLYWDRGAEVFVSGIWSPGDSAEAHYDDILVGSTFTSNIGTVYRSYESLIDTVFRNMADTPAVTRAAGYTEMSWGLYGDDFSIEAEESMFYDSGSFVRPSSGSNRVYLVTSGADSEEASESLKDIYVFETGRMVSDDGSKDIWLTPGVYNLADFPEGYYTLYGGSYIGPFMPAGRDSALLTGALAFSADGNLGYVIPSASGYTMVFGGTSRDISDFGMFVTYPDGNSTVTNRYSVAPILGSWDGFVTQTEVMAVKLLSSASAIWMLFDDASSADSQISIAAYSPDLDNLDLTAEQKYAIGVLSLVQTASWYGLHSSAITASDMTVSEASLSLMAVGTIRAPDGTILAENVVFTPFNWLDSQQVKVGTTVWNQSGFALVWGDAGTWSGESAYSDRSLVSLVAGSTLEIERLVYDGDEVSMLTLEPKEMQLVLSKFSLTPDPTPIPSGASDWIQILMVVAGLAALIGGIILRRPVMILIGAAVFLCGVFLADDIADFADKAGRWL
ncbi:hypothetical protein TALC_00377 [Thermoplasmatales archaeon BRNA1]|nr:hypothetical protein TALC_00377 [Thermoplasmatales archaeon BRNA1]